MYIVVDTSTNPIQIIDYTSSEDDMIKSYVSCIVDSDHKDAIEIFTSYNMRNIKRDLKY